MADLSEELMIEIYRKYLSERGYDTDKIPETHQQTPDLRIFDEEFEYYNEFKSPELIFDEAAQLYVFKTTSSKLLRTINKAVNQLSSYDPTHSRPWIVTCASTHFQLNWKKFTDSIQGGVVFDGTLSPDFTKTAVFQKVLTKIYQPDMYLWLQYNSEERKPYQATYILNERSNFKNEVEKLAVSLNNQKLGSMDNLIVMS